MNSALNRVILGRLQEVDCRHSVAKIQSLTLYTNLRLKKGKVGGEVVYNKATLSSHFCPLSTCGRCDMAAKKATTWEF